MRKCFVKLFFTYSLCSYFLALKYCQKKLLLVRLTPKSGQETFQDSVEFSSQVLIEEGVQDRVGARRRQADQVDDAVDGDDRFRIRSENVRTLESITI